MMELEPTPEYALEVARAALEDALAGLLKEAPGRSAISLIDEALGLIPSGRFGGIQELWAIIGAKGKCCFASQHNEEETKTSFIYDNWDTWEDCEAEGYSCKKVMVVIRAQEEKS